MAGEAVARLTLSYKDWLYPNRCQAATLDGMLGAFCDLYNAALQQRIEAWQRQSRHTLSADLVRRFTGIGVEDLNIQSLARGMLAKDVLDAAWAQLIFSLGYKAAKAGSVVVKVDPRGTSQTCPDCGTVKPKALSERTHRCNCGCVLDRDVAAAGIVHLRAFGAGNRPSVAKLSVAAA